MPLVVITSGARILRPAVVRDDACLAQAGISLPIRALAIVRPAVSRIGIARRRVGGLNAP
ncbi:MAG: hypothetical protein WB621_19590 [Candidatus Acidiferrales bacterium]